MNKAQSENYVGDTTLKEKLGSDRDTFAKLPSRKQMKSRRRLASFKFLHYFHFKVAA